VLAILPFASGMVTVTNTRAGHIACLAAEWLQRGSHVLEIFTGLSEGWLQRGTHVLGILRGWQRDGYIEEYTCWAFCVFGSWLATERTTRAGGIAGLAAGWLQRGTHVLGIQGVSEN
jgi:hypothetical protein